MATSLPVVPEVNPELTTAPEVKPKFRKEYQLTDAEGKAIGPPQVFEAETPEEVMDMLATAHIHASRKIHAQKQLITPETVQPSAKFMQHELTADELWDIKNKLNDPATVGEAMRRLLEAELGAPVSVVRERLTRSQEIEAQQKAEAEARKFVASHPEYNPVPENQDVIQAAMTEKGLAWTKRNLEIIYDEVKDRLVPKPIAVSGSTPEVTPSTPTTEPEAITSSPEPVTRPRGATSTGLMSRHATVPATTKQSDQSFAEEVAKMSTQEMKRRMAGDPAFVNKLNSLGKK